MNALIINSLLGNSTVSSKQNLFLNGDKNHQNLQVLSSRPGTALSAAAQSFLRRILVHVERVERSRGNGEDTHADEHHVNVFNVFKKLT